tara:strand:- start:133 stop:291 length:159 start_codon:yes stop_codon:yes gene_type:complete
MDEKLVNQYIQTMAEEINRLTQESIVLKSKLVVATQSLNALTEQQDNQEAEE